MVIVSVEPLRQIQCGWRRLLLRCAHEQIHLGEEAQSAIHVDESLCPVRVGVRELGDADGVERHAEVDVCHAAPVGEQRPVVDDRLEMGNDVVVSREVAEVVDAALELKAPRAVLLRLLPGQHLFLAPIRVLKQNKAESKKQKGDA